MVTPSVAMAALTRHRPAEGPDSMTCSRRLITFTPAPVLSGCHSQDLADDLGAAGPNCLNGGGVGRSTRQPPVGPRTPPASRHPPLPRIGTTARRRASGALARVPK